MELCSTIYGGINLPATSSRTLFILEGGGATFDPTLRLYFPASPNVTSTSIEEFTPWVGYEFSPDQPDAGETEFVLGLGSAFGADFTKWIAVECWKGSPDGGYTGGTYGAGRYVGTFFFQWQRNGSEAVKWAWWAAGDDEPTDWTGSLWDDPDYETDFSGVGCYNLILGSSIALTEGDPVIGEEITITAQWTADLPLGVIGDLYGELERGQAIWWLEVPEEVISGDDDWDWGYADLGPVTWDGWGPVTDPEGASYALPFSVPGRTYYIRRRFTIAPGSEDFTVTLRVRDNDTTTDPFYPPPPETGNRINRAILISIGDDPSPSPSTVNWLETGALGCGFYDVWIYERGGERPVAQVKFNSIKYNRKIDEVSTATVTVGIRGMRPYIAPPRTADTDVAPGYSFREVTDSCCWLLGEINPWQHELVIYRNGDLVWAGPIQIIDIGNDDGVAIIEADDMMKWFDRRFIRCEIDMSGADISAIWQAIFRSAHDIAPVNLTTSVKPTGIKGDRYYAPEHFRYAGDEMRELARTGLDWTAVGRTVHVGPQEISTPSIATLVDDNFQKAPRIIKSGIDTGTRWVVGGGGGGADGPTYWSEVPGTLQNDPTFGLIERYVNEPSILDADDPESSSRAAAQTRWDLLQAPVVYVKDGILSPSAGVTMNELVPGARVDLNLVDVCQPIIEEYRLQDVSVSFTVNDDGSSSEEVKITVSPLGTQGILEESAS